MSIRKGNVGKAFSMMKKLRISSKKRTHLPKKIEKIDHSKIDAYFLNQISNNQNSSYDDEDFIGEESYDDILNDDYDY
jgi:hypothetical protein